LQDVAEYIKTQLNMLPMGNMLSGALLADYQRNPEHWNTSFTCLATPLIEQARTIAASEGQDEMKILGSALAAAMMIQIGGSTEVDISMNITKLAKPGNGTTELFQGVIETAKKNLDDRSSRPRLR
ncbi:MAG: hypothetical protein V4490_02955, partial [Pseudomonadota bacterium]